jgi:hypothetical protein
VRGGVHNGKCEGFCVSVVVLVGLRWVRWGGVGWGAVSGVAWCIMSVEVTRWYGCADIGCGACSACGVP